ncbi:MAG: hypothetical protein AAGF20_09645 [Pseudomonadota bacterium]
MGFTIMAVTGCTTGKAAFGPANIGFSPEYIDAMLERPTTNSNDNKKTEEVAFSVSKKETVDGDLLLARLVHYEINNDTETVKKAKRAVVGALMAQSDRICNAYLTDVFAYQNTRNSSLAIAGATLTGLGTVLGPESTKAALTMVSGLTDTTSEVLDRNIFGDKGYELIAKSIVAKRLELSASLQETFNSENLENVPFGRLVKDVYDYHSYCALNKGISLVQDAAASTVQTNADNAETNDANARRGEKPNPSDGDGAGGAGGAGGT